MKKLAVVAIGGNSLITDKEHQSISDQYKAVCETACHIADLIEDGYNVVVGHGNGPQVGFILRRAEIAAKAGRLHPVPLVNCDADTQGAMGYQIQQAMDNEFRKRQLKEHLNSTFMKGKMLKTAVTVVTQVAVDKNDSAFKNPSKPIGSFYTDEQMIEIRQNHPDWDMMNDAGRGYRRVVASPKPIMILELEAIEILLKAGFCVIAAGGGGIPVIKTEDNQWVGIDAVIDKDFATSLLANQLNADLLVISTGVEKVYINFGKPNQKGLDKITIQEAKKYIKEGHFASGSMLPKVQAAIKFLENGGKEAIITDPKHLRKAALGQVGTHIVK
jgi:carbamate kinase